MLFSFAANAQCTELFFSQYIEGGGVNKSIEIYNPTSSDINLDNYHILMVRAGATGTKDSFGLSGMVASDDVYVLGHSGAASADLKSASDTLINGIVLNFNGDDCLFLVNRTSGDTVDVFGTVGSDPGSFWSWAGGNSTQNQTLTRVYGVQSGTVVWDTLEWTSLPQDDVTGLGSHSSSCNPPTATEPATAAATPTKDAVDVISI